MMRLAASGSRYFMHMSAGEAIAPPEWEEAGWQPPAPQLPSLQINFETPMAEFQDKVMGQHYILAYGDQRRAIRSLCRILGVDVI